MGARICRILENTKRMFPNAKVYLYGSRIYQLGDKNSDVNIYVDLGKLTFDRNLSRVIAFG